MNCPLSKTSLATIGDSHHDGTEIYWSERLQQWICVGFENNEITVADRLVACRVANAEIDADDIGLNQGCVACDLDCPLGLWVLALEGQEELPDFLVKAGDAVEIVWDTND